MPVADLVAALKARWRLELAITLLVAGLVFAVALAMPKTYVASAKLLFDERAPDPGGDAQQQAQPASRQEVLATQADVIQSDDVAREVVARERLLDQPGTRAAWQKATGGSIPADAWLAQRLLAGLKVEAQEGSNVASVSYTSADPRVAARIANAFCHAYLDTRLKLATDPARAYSQWFETHIAQSRRNLRRAQTALADFQRAHGILGSESINAEGDRLAQLSQQLAQADAQQADAAARAGGDRAASPDVQGSYVMTQLRTQIATKAGQVAQLSATLGPNHPDMVAARGELAALRAQLAAETGTMAHSLKVASGDAAARTAQLRRLVEAQRARMFALQADRSQLEVLQRDVQSASAAYDADSQRLNAMRLQAELPRANVRQLDEAKVPLVPARPNLPVSAVLGLMLGAMIALSVAAALEWLRPRVRTRAGLAERAGAPVLVGIDFAGSRAATRLAQGAF